MKETDEKSNTWLLPDAKSFAAPRVMDERRWLGCLGWLLGCAKTTGSWSEGSTTPPPLSQCPQGWTDTHKWSRRSTTKQSINEQYKRQTRKIHIKDKKGETKFSSTFLPFKKTFQHQTGWIPTVGQVWAWGILRKHSYALYPSWLGQF